ncbi:hypothetical protein Bhyg_01101 [Pseudolycoriella hygida]|uniref:NB-ARC domain-containing protein n=1 Tax=Pseudolycoriella hygida TaxID=35572 RepID=A0A9Q0S574_9DIPT|nr:hypothetical protein Bhyg_01101 [Pseudolycoriella hygida]
MADSFHNQGSVFQAGTVNAKIVNVVHNNYGKPISLETIFQADVPDINFVGRSPELELLKKATTGDPGPFLIAVVTGLGGVGKTQLIRKFIQDNEQSYNHIIWINSDQREQIEENFRTLAEELGIPTRFEGTYRKFDNISRDVFGRLATSNTSELRNLMVFDNVDKKTDCDFVFKIATSGKRPHVIITSRIQEWSDSIQLIKLEVFDTDVAIEYISKTLIDPNKKYKDSVEDKTKLAEKLQNFPLALKQATAHINHQRKMTTFRITDFIHNYNAQAVLGSTHFQNDIFNTYTQTTYKTWGITIDAIKKCGSIGSLAIRILNIIAYFNPDRIRRDIFFNLSFSESESDVKENVMLAVRLLVNYSMVDCQDDQSTLSIHRLVQQVQIVVLENSNMSINILRDGLSLVEKYDIFVEIYEHAIVVFLAAKHFAELIREFRTLPHVISKELYHCMKYSRAIDFGKKILHNLVQIFGEDGEIALLTKSSIALSHLELKEHIDEGFRMLEDKTKRNFRNRSC